MIYETKGLSLEEIDEMYEKLDFAWKSEGYVPKTHFRDHLNGAGGNAEKDKSSEGDHSSDHAEVAVAPEVQRTV